MGEPAPVAATAETLAAASVPPTRVLVAMSGGVDSSVAAALLRQAGHEVIGCFMRLGEAGEAEGLVPDDGMCATGGRRKQGCCSVNDAADARVVAATLGIPLYVMNFRREFGRIIDQFVAEYQAGRTPNPCVRCNDWLKFGRLHEHAETLGATHVASGHYAVVRRGEAGAELHRGADLAKDQTYALFGIRPDRLARTIFPLGDLEKPAVRELASRLGLPVFDKPDSQEICFVPDQDYAGLLERRAPGSIRPGALVDEAGRTIGEHRGHQHFTVGQRRGLGVAATVPLYVLSKNAARNEVVVGPKAALRCRGAEATEINWLDGDPPADWIECEVQWRLHGEAAAARVRTIETETGLRLDVEFAREEERLAPGQAVVCYRQGRVLGGAWIDRVLDRPGAGRAGLTRRSDAPV